MPTIALVTCAEWPELLASDAAYAQALRAAGAEVRVVPWNASPPPAEALRGCACAVLRAPWDYPRDVPGFLAWIAAVEASGVPLWNPPALVRWNLDKRYMFALARAGVPVPRSALLDLAAGPAQWGAALDEIGAGDGPAVLKPCWGGSGLAVGLTRRATIAEDLARAAAEAGDRPWMVQEFLPAIATAGETSFVFLDGHFAHAVLKRPAAGEFRVNSRYAPLPPELVTPPPAHVAAAARVLAALPEMPLYARIDGTEDAAGGFLCLEAEVIDPALFLHLAPASAAGFAAATLARCRS